MGAHEMAAVVFKAKELQLTEEEAFKLGHASAKVLDLYNVRMTPQQEAWGLLIKTSVLIYYPRVLAIQERQKEERNARKRAIPAAAT